LLVVGGDWTMAGREATGDSAALAAASTVADPAWEGSSDFIELYDPTAPELAIQALGLPCGVDFEVAGEDPKVESVGGESRAAGAIGLMGDSSLEQPAGRTTIDVMILYTPEALARSGQPAMEDTIQYAVACANETMRRSRVPVEVRLVHHAEAVGHLESGFMGQELSWLTHDLGVQQLREEYGADLVSLIVARGQYAGLANCGGSHSVYCGNPVVYAHEIGHNFDCSHDRGQDRVCAVNDYSYAHTFKVPDCGVTFGTIMSYVGSVILNYSNPSVPFRGCATGLPEGHLDESGSPDSADNARTVAAAAPEIARRKAARVSSLENPGFDETGTRFSFEIVVHTLETHSVEYTADFVRWYPVADPDISSGRATVVDPVASVGARFYRAHAGAMSPPRMIGFYRLAIGAGSTLIANQLDLGDNAVGRVLRDLPVGSVLHKWDASSQSFVKNVKLDSGWSLPEMCLHPGEGAILDCDQALEITFVGQVQPAFYRSTDRGWSLISSPVPQAGPVSSVLGLPVGYGSQLDRVQATPERSFEVGGWTCRNGVWEPESEPEIGIGRAFWLYQSPNCYIWKRVFLPSECSGTDPEEVVLSVRHGGNSGVVVTAHTRSGGRLRIEGSSNLKDWTILTAVTGESGGCCWADPEGCAQGQRFYRVIRTEPSSGNGHSEERGGGFVQE
jgi:hypothetical protein